MGSEFHTLGILELPEWEFKTNVMNMIMNKVDNMQEQMGNISRQIEIQK